MEGAKQGCGLRWTLGSTWSPGGSGVWTASRIASSWSKEQALLPSDQSAPACRSPWEVTPITSQALLGKVAPIDPEKLWRSGNRWASIHSTWRRNTLAGQRRVAWGTIIILYTFIIQPPSLLFLTPPPPSTSHCNYVHTHNVSQWWLCRFVESVPWAGPPFSLFHSWKLHLTLYNQEQLLSSQ